MAKTTPWSHKTLLTLSPKCQSLNRRRPQPRPAVRWELGRPLPLRDHHCSCPKLSVRSGGILLPLGSGWALAFGIGRSRERQVIGLVVDGLLNKQIADKFSTSEAITRSAERRNN